MKRKLLLAVALAALAGCGAPTRVLVIKSVPADAKVCIKGRSDGGYFTSREACVGTTPFDADRVEVAGRQVKFKDVESAKESFYVIVSRPGYAPQAVEVPAWDQLVVLKPEVH